MRWISVLGVLVTGVFPFSAQGGEGGWVIEGGEEFRVNIHTVNDQSGPSVGMDGEGNTMVAWTDRNRVYLPDPGELSGEDVLGQMFDLSGERIGTEFVVNTEKSRSQTGASIAARSSGAFLVVWESDGQDHTHPSLGERGVYGQLYDRNGDELGPEFQCNTSVLRAQRQASVATNAEGNFVVVWGSRGQDGSGYGIYGQRFDRDGNRVEEEFHINTYTQSDQRKASVAMDAEGDFVVVWGSRGQDGSGYGIYGQRFDRDGDRIEEEFRINRYTEGDQKDPCIAMDRGGRFVVVWSSRRGDGGGYDIYAQRHSVDGTRMGSAILVNDLEMRILSSFSSIGMDAEGDYVVVWHSYGEGDPDIGVYAQVFGGTEGRIGDRFLVNVYTEDWQTYPSVAMRGLEDFVVVWESKGQDGSGKGVYGRRFSAIKKRPTGEEWELLLEPGIPSAGKKLHTIDDTGIPWSDARWISVDADVGSESGRMQPLQVAPRQNLCTGVLHGMEEVVGGRGRIWADPPMRPADLETLIDSNLESGFVRPFREAMAIYIDLGMPFGVNRVEICLTPLSFRGEISPLPQEMEVGISADDPLSLLPVWSGNMGGRWEEDVTFPTQPVRYVGIKVARAEMVRLFEVGVYGEGYVPRATYISRVIRLGEIVAFGDIGWEGGPEGAGVFVRTRTGFDNTPDVYTRRDLDTGRETDISEDTGKPLTFGEYYELPLEERGEILTDSKRWSFWSAPYDFDAGGGGVPIVSPPGGYLQFRIDFEGTFETQGRVRTLFFESSYPMAAHQIIGEISPPEVEPARVTTFTYVIRPRITGKDTGFDSVEILTPMEAEQIHSVTVDRIEVPFTVEFEESPTRFVVHFPRLWIRDDNALLEITFDCAVLRYGTAFIGRVYDSEADQYPQLVVPGDAKRDFGEDDITVQTDLEKPLIVDVDLAPNLFTPNGDGINDVLTISYSLLKLIGGVPVTVEVYDLSGRWIRRVYEGYDGGGVYAREWDGRDEWGHPLPPGMYVYSISVDADYGRDRRVGVVALTY